MHMPCHTSEFDVRRARKPKTAVSRDAPCPRHDLFRLARHADGAAQHRSSAEGKVVAHGRPARRPARYPATEDAAPPAPDEPSNQQ